MIGDAAAIEVKATGAGAGRAPEPPRRRMEVDPLAAYRLRYEPHRLSRCATHQP